MKWFVILIPLTFCLSCTGKNQSEFSGRYEGIDGASQNPQPIQLVVAVTGDGFLNGSWKSAGEIKEGQFSGRMGIFEGDLALNVFSGGCVGKFKGHFSLSQKELSGTLNSNPHCPEKSFSFKAARTSH